MSRPSMINMATSSTRNDVDEGHYSSGDTITQQPTWHGSMRQEHSLAGRPRDEDQDQAPGRGQAYLHPEYKSLNPDYGKNHPNGPVWSLASPLPRVVRPRMRPEPAPAAEEPPSDTGSDTTRRYQGPEGEHGDRKSFKRNINAERDTASEEPPAAEPSDPEQERAKAEVQQATPDKREFFNRWGRVRYLVRQEIAEWLGATLAMTLGLCAGLSTYTSANSAGSFPSLAAAWGFAFMIGIYISGGVSGGHLNPAISISMSIWRGFSGRRCWTYALAQILGAMTATGIAYGLYRDAIMASAASSNVPPNQSGAKDALITLPKTFVAPAAAFFTEFVGSAIIMGAILALGDDANAPPGAGMQAFVIGILITVLVLALGYTTGGCFNPVRDLGPRLVMLMAGWGGNLFKEYYAWWIWGPWAADISGMLFGGFLYDAIIFTGGESPVNYPQKRFKGSKIMKERNWRKMTGFGKKSKIEDLEKATKENE
ncbi:MIP/aquaporin family protein [Aspergillus undulatus]|uniref:MIP/aquaporin family protein n=1 Tax=Aspergillus undulatus TaxID=1810928 RepID=UPI003CCD14B6